jgi:hypothetical protein
MAGVEVTDQQTEKEGEGAEVPGDPTEAVGLVPAPAGWAELTYRYVKHYFWEPQHLLLQTKRLDPPAGSRTTWVDRAMRRQEVPLNYLFNVMLRILPASIRAASLRSFGLSDDDLMPPALRLMAPGDWRFIQPDVHLESPAARVFIELKVDAPLTLKQVLKYVRLHDALNRRDVRRRSYVLLLVRKRNKPLVFKDTGGRVEPGAIAAALASDLGNGTSVTFGVTTWQHFGDGLRQELNDHPSDTLAGEMLHALVGDFLDELAARGLYMSWP